MEKMLERKWNTINQKTITLIDELEPYIEKEELTIHIGTDAQSTGKKSGVPVADFVTCVIVHGRDDDGRSFSRVFYHKDRTQRISNLWEKLYTETINSVMTASELTELVPSLQERIVVHVDANPKKEHASSDYVKQLAGMVMGMGFKNLIKPDSWASSHAADHIVKNRHHKVPKFRKQRRKKVA